MEEMVKYKIPASITLAQGILESGNGQSKLARQGNNHFGIKCHSDWKGKTMRMDDDAPKECFRVYKNAEESYRDHSKFLKNGSRYGTAETEGPLDASGIPQISVTSFRDDFKDENIGVMYSSLRRDYKEFASIDPKRGKLLLRGDESLNSVVTDVKQPGEVPVLANCKVIGMTDDHHFIRENFGVKFVFTKQGDDLDKLAKELKLNKRQLVNYNNLGNKTTFAEGEVLYIGPKRRKAAGGYKIHVIQQGETLSQVSRLYAVKLERLYKMNGLDEKAVIQVGQVIKLR